MNHGSCSFRVVTVPDCTITRPASCGVSFWTDQRKAQVRTDPESTPVNAGQSDTAHLSAWRDRAGYRAVLSCPRKRPAVRAAVTVPAREGHYLDIGEYVVLHRDPGNLAIVAQYVYFYRRHGEGRPCQLRLSQAKHSIAFPAAQNARRRMGQCSSRLAENLHTSCSASPSIGRFPDAKNPSLNCCPARMELKLRPPDLS